MPFQDKIFALHEDFVSLAEHASSPGHKERVAALKEQRRQDFGGVSSGRMMQLWSIAARGQGVGAAVHRKQSTPRGKYRAANPNVLTRQGPRPHGDTQRSKNPARRHTSGACPRHRLHMCTAADHSRLQGITIYYLNTLLRLSTQFHSTRERESETFKNGLI